MENIVHHMTFNEINCVKHHPYVSVGIVEENHPALEQAKYQGAHHQFIASALATKACNQIIPESKVGCMISYQILYPHTYHQDDLQAWEDAQRVSLFCARGLPAWTDRLFCTKGIALKKERGDDEILRQYPVEFVSFSYYTSSI